jgi:hypothetical protein
MYEAVRDSRVEYHRYDVSLMYVYVVERCKGKEDGAGEGEVQMEEACIRSSYLISRCRIVAGGVA